MNTTMFSPAVMPNSMKLSHLTKRQRKDGSQYIAGTARYGIPTSSPVMLKKCQDHDDYREKRERFLQ